MEKTHALRKRSFKFMDIPLLFQMFSMLCDVFRAIANLRLISIVLSHLLFISDPRYSNCFTASIFCPSSRKSAPLSFLSRTIIFVFLVFSRRPFSSLALLTWESRFMRSWRLLHNRVVSSAYLRLLTLTPPNLLPPSTPSHLGYCMVKHVAMIICADRPEWLCQIQRYNNSPSYVTVKVTANSINTRIKRDLIPSFKFLECNIFDSDSLNSHLSLGIGCWNPAFDVTPGDLITGGIITEFGVFSCSELAEKLKQHIEKRSTWKRCISAWTRVTRLIISICWLTVELVQVDDWWQLACTMYPGEVHPKSTKGVGFDKTL